MALSLTVLGASGTYAAPGGACSGYLVSDGDVNVWVDCGPGTLANLQHHVGLDAVDAIIVSHVHPDHWLELPVVRNAFRYGLDRQGVPVFSTGETLARFEAIVDDGIGPTLDWQTITDGDRFQVGALRFRCSRTDHPVETLALRVDYGQASLVYSADTAAGWSPRELGPGIDLAVMEATMPSDNESDAPHLTARQAGGMARDADVSRLLITHIWPTLDADVQRRDASDAFGAPVEVATVHQRYEVNSP